MDIVGGGNKAGLTQGGDHGLVDNEGGGHIQCTLDQIEGQEDGQQHLCHGLAGNAHVQGSDEVVPQDHHHRQSQRGNAEADDGAVTGVVLLVDEGSSAGKHGGGQHIHDAADGAGAADGEHLDNGHHKGDDGGGDGAVDKAADADDGLLDLQLQESGNIGDALAQ